MIVPLLPINTEVLDGSVDASLDVQVDHNGYGGADGDCELSNKSIVRIADNMLESKTRIAQLILRKNEL